MIINTMENIVGIFSLYNEKENLSLLLFQFLITPRPREHSLNRDDAPAMMDRRFNDDPSSRGIVLRKITVRALLSIAAARKATREGEGLSACWPFTVPTVRADRLTSWRSTGPSNSAMIDLSNLCRQCCSLMVLRVKAE